MQSRYLLAAYGIVAFLGVACSNGLPATGPLADQPAPTLSQGAEQAFRRAATQFIPGVGGNTMVLGQPATVRYVETTVGQARELFEPSGPRTAPDVPNDTPAWVFIAYGRFQYFCMGCRGNYSPIYTSAIAVIPKDGSRVFSLGTGYDEKIELSQLDSPVDVPLSLIQQLCSESGQDRCVDG